MNKGTHFIGQPMYGQDTRKTCFSPDKRHEHVCRGNCGHIQKALGNRASLQTTQAEFPSEIFLWRKRKCHKDTDMGNTHSKSAAYGDAETY